MHPVWETSQFWPEVVTHLPSFGRSFLAGNYIWPGVIGLQCAVLILQPRALCSTESGLHLNTLTVGIKTKQKGATQLPHEVWKSSPQTPMIFIVCPVATYATLHLVHLVLCLCDRSCILIGCGCMWLKICFNLNNINITEKLVIKQEAFFHFSFCILHFCILHFSFCIFTLLHFDQWL